MAEHPPEPPADKHRQTAPPPAAPPAGFHAPPAGFPANAPGTAQQPDRPAKRTCLFGGSFDPVHNGHIAMAQAAIRHCNLDRVVFLPANISPFKQSTPPLFTAGQRLTLLNITLAGQPGLEISDLDLRLPPPSWTWRLVEHWQQQHPTEELYWLMGTDQWNQLHRWAHYTQLIGQLRFIVYTRGDTLPANRTGIRVTLIQARHPASSSGIRQALRANHPIPAGWMQPAAAAKAQAFFAEATV